MLHPTPRMINGTIDILIFLSPDKQLTNDKLDSEIKCIPAFIS